MKLNRMMYCLANVIHPPNGSYAFSANPSTKDFTATLFRYIKAKGIRKIALLTSTDSSGQPARRRSTPGRRGRRSGRCCAA